MYSGARIQAAAGAGVEEWVGRVQFDGRTERLTRGFLVGQLAGWDEGSLGLHSGGDLRCLAALRQSRVTYERVGSRAVAGARGPG